MIQVLGGFGVIGPVAPGALQQLSQPGKMSVASVVQQGKSAGEQVVRAIATANAPGDQQMATASTSGGTLTVGGSALRRVPWWGWAGLAAAGGAAYWYMRRRRR